MTSRTRPSTTSDRAAAAGAFAVRPADPHDLGFVREMLSEAAFWRLGAPRPAASTNPLDAPELAVYVDDWGRAGDRALIACRAERLHGAAWFRLFTEQSHGYGFVDPETPELAVAVVATHRGHGIGTALVASALAQAALDGFSRLSLSVEPDNPAAGLYQRLGFRRVTTNVGSWTMVAACRPGPLRDVS